MKKRSELHLFNNWSRQLITSFKSLKQMEQYTANMKNDCVRKDLKVCFLKSFLFSLWQLPGFKVRHLLRHIVVFSLYMCISRPEKNIPYLASLSVFVSQVTRGRTSLRYVTNVSKSLNKLNVSFPGSIKTKTRPVIFQLSKKDTTGDKRVCVCKVNIDCWRHKSKQKNESFSNYFFLHLHVEP